MRWSTKKRILSVIFHVCVSAICLLMIYPVLYMLLGSFKTQQDIFQHPTTLIPEVWNFKNYANGWKGFGGTSFSTFFRNSILITIIAVIGQIASSAIIAYGFARCRFRGKKLWFAIVIVTMMMPAQVLIIPQYIMFNTFGWINSWLPLIIPGFFGFPFFIFLIHQFMTTIPMALDESAYIDGCSKYSIFYRIILPLVKPALITAMIFAIYWKWDDFFGPMIYLTDIKKYTVSVALKMFTDPAAQSDWGAAYAMAVLSLLPVMVIFFAFQQYLVEGISTTGIKG